MPCPALLCSEEEEEETEHGGRTGSVLTPPESANIFSQRPSARRTEEGEANHDRHPRRRERYSGIYSKCSSSMQSKFPSLPPLCLVCRGRNQSHWKPNRLSEAVSACCPPKEGAIQIHYAVPIGRLLYQDFGTPKWNICILESHH